MKPIRSLDELVDFVKTTNRRRKLAVAVAEDPNTITAIAQAIKAGFAEAIMVGDRNKIIEVSQANGIDPEIFTIVDIPDQIAATKEALRLVKQDEADILMKGLVGTDKFLGAVLHKEKGLLPPKAVMSYVCALEVPKYHKLLFITDPAVIPFPDVNQKIAMYKYAVTMANKFGIEEPKVALLGAAEKVNPKIQSSVDSAVICKMVKRGQLPPSIVDGPLDMFLACDPASVEIKGVPTPVNGDADVLLFPNIEATNTFYKGLMLFGGGELAGMIQGTTKPVVVMSRSESPKSKFYCIALSCLMAE